MMNYTGEFKLEFKIIKLLKEKEGREKDLIKLLCRDN